MRVEIRFSGTDMLYANKRMRLCNNHLSAMREFGRPRFSVPEEYAVKIGQTPDGVCPICHLKPQLLPSSHELN